MVEVALVVVALAAVRLVIVEEVKFCCWEKVLLFARFREATTAPVVGEMVSEPSLLETEDTAPPPPPTQVPLIAKQPDAISKPPAKVEVAVEEPRRAPVMEKLPMTVEEALAIKPVSKFANPATVRVEEADNGPETFRLLEMVEEPRTSRPPRLVKRPASVRTPASKVEKMRIP